MGKKLKADVVVVGSGPGGATVAKDLVKNGKEVIVIEKGGDNKPSGNVIGALKFQGGLNFLGNGMIITRDFLQIVRCLTTGGTSMMFLACAWDPPREMFAKYGIDISNEVDEIKQEVPVTDVPDKLLGPAAKILTKSAQELGYDWKKIPKFLRAENCRTNCNKCYFGCPHYAKWHARDWIKEAESIGLKLMTNMSCEGAIVEDGKATGIKAIDKKGVQYEISADAVVVSAGGIGSPVILQKSGIHEAGGSFFFDPFVCAFGYLDKRLSTSKEFPMITGVHLEDEGVMVTDMPLPFEIFVNYALMGFKPHKLLRSKGKLGLLIKVRDTMGGHISIDEKINAKPLTIEDHFKLNRGRAIARDVLENAGAKDVWYSGVAAAHPGGTCRIGHVVDNHLETRVKNLYVSDASVIPEPWGLPPSLTVMSLSRQLSKRLLGSS